MIQVEARDAKALLSDLQEKYTQVSAACQEEKSKNFELQNQLKQIEMARKYQEQSGAMERDERQGVIEQLKKNIAERDRQIQFKNKEIEELSRQINQLKEQETAVK